MTSLVDLVIEKFDGEIVVPNQWRVDGSNGKKYTVKWDKYHRSYSCTCLGYTYRRRCKHTTQIIDSFKQQLSDSIKLLYIDFISFVLSLNGNFHLELHSSSVRP